MTILAAGTSLADMIIRNGAPYSSNGLFKGPYVAECAVLAGGSNGGATFGLPFETASDDFWHSFHWRSPTQYNRSGAFIAAFRQSMTSAVLFKLVSTSSSAGAFYYWNGTTYVSLGTISLTEGLGDSTERWDIHIKMHDTTGVIEGYCNGALKFSYSGDTIFTAATTIGWVEHEHQSVTTSIAAVSSEFVSTLDSRNLELAQLQPTSDGANTGFTGGYSQVGKVARNDLTWISSAAAGDIETFNMGDVPADLAGQTVHAVVAASRARRGATGPQTLKAAARIGSTNYELGTYGALDNAFSRFAIIAANNPATSSAWITSEINGAQFGVKSGT